MAAASSSEIPSKSPDDPKTSRRQKLAKALQDWRSAFKNVPTAFALVWRADRASAIGMGVLTLVSGSLPAVSAQLTRLVVDSVAGSVQSAMAVETAFSRVLPYLFLELLVVIATQVMGQARRYLRELLDHRLGHHINTSIIRKALSLELRWFEDPDFYDKMQNARRQSEYRAMAIVDHGFFLVQSLITLGSFVALLLAFSPGLALLLCLATLPAFVAQGRYSKLQFRLQSWRAPETRMMSYLEQTLTSDTAAKEIRIFGLGMPLLRRYDAIFWKAFNEDRKLGLRRSLASLAWGALSTATFYGAYAWIIWKTVARSLSLGGMTMYLSVIRQSTAAIEGAFSSVNGLYENGLFMENLRAFLAIEGQSAQPVASAAAGGSGAVAGAALSRAALAPDRSRGIEFRDVSFKYHHQEKWALRGVNLEIRPGEKLALVGENGAGKTTLVKLLSRLYEPTEGAVLYQGIDLRAWGPDELRRRIGVIFQDYMRFQLSLRENVGFGDIAHLDEEARVLEAGRQGGADSVATELAEGWNTSLGSWFKDGRELSGGQWQKVALSRAFMRDGEILVLDEPTSALDPEREFEVFQRFQELAAGKTAIVISHRFSTVRLADRIAVLEGGRVSELGSHAELLTRHGTYARLFEMQAQGYR